MATLRSVLRRQQGVNFQRQRKKAKKRSDAYTGSQYDKASFTALSLHYPVCMKK